MRKIALIAFVVMLAAAVSHADSIIVTNYFSSSVSIINSDDRSTYATISLSNQWAKGVAVRPQADFAFVTNFGASSSAYGPLDIPDVPTNNLPSDFIGDSITVLSLTTIPPSELLTISSLGISSLSAPSDIVLTNDGNRAYVACANDFSVTVIDTNPSSPFFCTILTKLSIQDVIVDLGGSWPVFRNPWAIDINPAGTIIYVVCPDVQWSSDDTDDRVVLISVNNNAVLGYFDIDASGDSWYSNPNANSIGISSDGTTAFLPVFYTASAPGGGLNGACASVCSLSPLPGSELLKTLVTNDSDFYGLFEAVYASDTLVITGANPYSYPTRISFVTSTAPYAFSVISIGQTGTAEVRHIGISEDGNTAYAALFFEDSIGCIDVTSQSITSGDYVTVGNGPWDVNVIASAVTPDSTVDIITTSIGDAVVGEVYSTTLVAAGGEQPYSWSIASGALPTGLILFGSTGNISGTPTVPGTYNFTVQVADNAVLTSTDTQDFEMVVNVSVVAGIGYSPQSFTFTALEGEANPSVQTMNIFNEVSLTYLFWAVDDNASWLSVLPSGGTSTGETDPVTLSVDIAGLSAGTYTASLRISGNATNSPRFANVTLIVNSYDTPAAINVSPLEFTFNAATGLGDPAPQELLLWNSGTEVLNWTVDDDSEWLSISPASGTSYGETDVLSLSVDTSGLSVGEYVGFIGIYSPGATNTPQVVKVTLVMENPFPEIQKYPNKLVFYAITESANPPSQTITLWDTRVAPLEWQLTDTAEWLTVSPTSGTAVKGESTGISVGVSMAGLEPGIYPATITIVGEAAVNSPQTVTVLLNLSSPSSVLPPPQLLTPYSGELVDTGSPGFTWEPILKYGTVTYIFQLDDAQDFASSLRFVSGLADPAYTVYGTLPDGTYYWRVRAMNSMGEAGSWSEIHSVVVDAPDTGTPGGGGGGGGTTPPTKNDSASTSTADGGSSTKTCFLGSLVR